MFLTLHWIMKLADDSFNKQRFIRRLESLVNLMLAFPLVAFGYVLLEKEASNELRSVIMENPDWLFHGVMVTAVVYVLYRTVLGWGQQIRKFVEGENCLDTQLKMIKRPLLYRNFLWVLGAFVGVYGLYEKGDMFYALIFTIFLVLISANRPTGRYFATLLKLKKEERDWMIR